MKNNFFALFLACALAFSLSTNAFADGEIPIGGKTCPQTGTPCLASPQDDPNQDPENQAMFQAVLNYLTQLFG